VQGRESSSIAQENAAFGEVFGLTRRLRLKLDILECLIRL
jgi:hypothetical protein